LASSKPLEFPVVPEQKTTKLRELKNGLVKIPQNVRQNGKLDVSMYDNLFIYFGNAIA
jgi:hypothetical protein